MHRAAPDAGDALLLELLRSLLHLPAVGPLQATGASAVGVYAGFLAASIQRGAGADLPPLLLQALGRGLPWPISNSCTQFESLVCE